jgi:hypothetical protein
MSSHPGTTLADAVEMATWLKKWGYMPEQVQDFYPTPGTISTVMYYTGINPMNGKKVYVTTDYHEKQLQRALLQYSKPENANLVREALRLAKREDLIGTGPNCLVRPSFSGGKYVPDKKSQKPSTTKKNVKNSKSYEKNHGRKNAVIDAKAKPKTKSKFDRVFGEDANRIRREADRLSAGSSQPKRSAKNTTKNKKTTQKRSK